MHIAIGLGADGGVSICQVHQGSARALNLQHLGPIEAAAEFIQTIETRERPRWILSAAATVYPRLRQYGVRLDRSHDIELVEGLLVATEGDWGAPRSLAAAHARMLGETVPAPAISGSAALSAPEPPTLFDRPTTQIVGVDPAVAVAEVYADQVSRIASTVVPKAFGLLCACDSAGGLLAVEMTEAGIPWDVGVHNKILHDLLGDRTAAGTRPPKLAALAEGVRIAFGGKPINPDSPAEVLAAFARDGIELETTRSWTLRGVDHPAVAPLLAYKELSRINSANGWSWQSTWIRDRRFRPEYLPAGVVSGRWATRGGGALQIPRRLRSAVVADDGRVLVVADAAQLEPRILAAMSADPGMTRAAMSEDMYAALAAESFNNDRGKAKVGLLGAMYGQVGGQAAAPLAVLRARYPRALNLLEQAAWSGERGQLVRSHLGRTCPPTGLEDPTPAQQRARGRFTRNFVVQGTAAEWAEALLATLRARLHALTDGSPSAQIVFYQHDEVMVHADAELVDEVIDALEKSALEATELLFGKTPVRLPLNIKAARVYADAHS